MSYRIYLQTVEGGTFEKTETESRSIAETVFRAFIERDELEGKPVSVHLVHMRSTLAVHRFDEAAGADNWQGREDDIPWPEGTGRWRAQERLSRCRQHRQGEKNRKGKHQRRHTDRVEQGVTVERHGK